MQREKYSFENSILVYPNAFQNSYAIYYSYIHTEKSFLLFSPFDFLDINITRDNPIDQ